MHRATIQRIELCTVTLLLFAGEVARAGALDRGARVCLHSPDLPIANAAADPRTKDLQTRLVRALEAAGFTLPDPAAVDAAVEREVKSAEGVVDPYTGRWDRDRYAARVAAVSEALRAELQCEARMAAAVRPVYAHFNQDVAYWDHTKEHVSSGGRVALNALGGVTEWGFVPALSLWLRVFDLEGEEIAFRSRQFDRAGQTIDRHLARTPNSGRAYYLKAEVARHTLPEGHSSAAVRSAYERALELDPEYPDALRALGLLLREAGEANCSRDLLERYLRAAPGAVDRSVIERYIRASAER